MQMIKSTKISNVIRIVHLIHILWIVYKWNICILSIYATLAHTTITHYAINSFGSIQTDERLTNKHIYCQVIGKSNYNIHVYSFKVEFFHLLKNIVFELFHSFWTISQ